MHNSSLLALKEFLKKHPEGDMLNLLKFLSPDMQDQINNIYLPKIPMLIEKFKIENLKKDVHYSWYIPLFESHTKNTQKILLCSLDPESSQKLEKILKIKKSKKTFPKIVLNFFKKIILESIFEKPNFLLPIEYLKDSELNLLLTLPKLKLIKLIDFLALYDLSLIMPKIVQTKILKRIDKFLSPKKRDFLKSIRSYKEPFSFPPLKIKEAIDSKEDFKLLLHRRGLLRFSKALCMQDNDLIWYICHKLDIGRGKTLLKLCEKKAPLKVVNKVTSNVLELLPIINEEP